MAENMNVLDVLRGAAQWCQGKSVIGSDLGLIEAANRIAELIAADVEYDAADRAFDYSALDTAAEIEAASSRYTAAIKRRAAALSACTGGSNG